MNKALLIAFALLCCAGFAFAQPDGSVGVYASDDYGYLNAQSCENLDYQNNPPTINPKVYLTFHFVHVTDICATAVEFQFDRTQLTGTNGGDSCPFALKLGDFQAGVSISYGGTLTGQIYLGSNTVIHPGNMQHLCKYVYVKNHPTPSVEGATTPLAVGCPTGWLTLDGSFGVVSYDFTNCRCFGSVPTEESSWGKIKALYE